MDNLINHTTHSIREEPKTLYFFHPQTARLLPHRNRKILNSLRHCHGGGLLVASQFLHPVTQVDGELVDGDIAIAGKVRLALEPLHQRLGEGAVAPGGIFQGVLFSGGAGKDYDAVLRRFEVVDHCVDIGHPLSRTHDVAGVAGVDKRYRFTRKIGEGFLDVVVLHGGAAQSFGVGVPGQVVVVAVFVVDAVTGDKEHRYVQAGHLIPQPVEAVEQVTRGGVLQGLDLYLTVEPAGLAFDHSGKVAGILGGVSQVELVVIVVGDADGQGVGVWV